MCRGGGGGGGGVSVCIMPEVGVALNVAYLVLPGVP